MRGLITLGVLLGLIGPLHAGTALQAIKLLPKGQAAHIARIEGRDGAPEPDRWYILTHDPAAENGVHEYVISNGVIVASRSLSQFADTLATTDVLPSRPAFDSDKAERIASQFAAANGALITSYNYELKKMGPGGLPTWTISCMDDKGSKAGELVVTATHGTVVSHDGFEIMPSVATLTPAPVSTPPPAVAAIPTATPALAADAVPEISPPPISADATASPAASPETTAATRDPHFDTYAKPEVAVSTASPSPGVDTTTETRSHKKADKKPPTGVAKTIDDVGRTLHKFLPF